MASIAAITTSGKTLEIYASPAATYIISTSGISTTLYFTNSAGVIEATSTFNDVVDLSTSTSYDTYTSTIAPAPTYYLSTVTSGKIISTAYIPISTISTTEDGVAVTSVLYGQSDISKAILTYTTTYSLSANSSLPPGSTTSTTTTINYTTFLGTPPAELSTGAKAGIGIGVTLAVLLFAAILAGWLLIRRRRRASPHLSEVAPIGHGACDKPELDASEGPNNSSAGHTFYGQSENPGHGKSEMALYDEMKHRDAKLDAAGRLGTGGKVELEGRMVPRDDKITRKQVGSAKTSSMVDDKEVMYEV
jgi:hypothetical protein